MGEVPEIRALFDAIDARDPEAMRALLGAGVDVNGRDRGFEGFTSIVAGLLAAGANPDVAENHGFTPLHQAAENPRGGAIEALLAAGASRQGRADADPRRVRGAPASCGSRC